MLGLPNWGARQLGLREVGQAAEARTKVSERRPIGRVIPIGRVTRALTASDWAARSDTSLSIRDIGRFRAAQIDPSSSEDASFSPRSTSLR